MKTTIAVRYRNGLRHYTRLGGSAAQVRQVLEILSTKLRREYGDYQYELAGDTRLGYSIVARYPGGSFTESTGATPGKALGAFQAALRILRRDHEGDWNEFHGKNPIGKEHRMMPSGAPGGDAARG